MMNLDKPTDTIQPDPQPAWPPAAPSSSVQLGESSRFVFTGTASEYFGIWIVNILLIIVTIGFYAPWAKVRRLRYFYGNSWLEHENFDFTGIPTKILLGRIIAIGLYITAAGLTSINPDYAWAFPILILLVLPWLLRATYRFNARNSKYRNSRFYFSGTNPAAYKTYLGWIMLTVLSLGLLFPYAFYKHKQYQFEHLHVGQVPFKLHATVRHYYAAMLIPLVFYIAIVAFVGFLITSVWYVLVAILMPLIIVLVVYLSLGLLIPFMQGAVYRITWSNLSVGNSRFSCDLNEWRYVWIVATNLLARIASLGLLTPWAAIRLHKYKIESLSIVWQDDPSYILSVAQQDHPAFAEEMSDILDIDVSL